MFERLTRNIFNICSKTFKKAAAIFMLFAFLCQPAAAFAGGLVNVEDATGKNVYFGNFYQSADTSKTGTTITRSAGLDASDFNYEALKWQVLDTQDGNLTLLTSQGVVGTKQVKWNEQGGYGNNWCTSNARAYLNGLDGTLSGTQPCNSNYTASGTNFLTQAFTETEQKYIKETQNKTYSDDSGTAELCTTQDKIFLLSTQEVQDTTGTYMNTSAERKTSATDYAYSWGAYDCSSPSSRTAGQSAETAGTSSWFLRSPYPYDSDYARYVNGNGDINYIIVYSDYSALRPALNLESSLFLSAAAGGKSDVAEGAGFALNTEYSGNDYKLTLKTDTINTPTNIIVTQKYSDGTVDGVAANTSEGGTMDLTNGVVEGYGAVKVSYTGATTGTNKYVSAIVSDTSGNLVNYAKVKSAETEGSGTDVIVGTNNLAEGVEYKMQLFGEEANVDYATDYASNLSTEYTIYKSGGGTTKNEGTLGAAYKAKGLTAQLGNGFNLSFENAVYDTAVNVESTGATVNGNNSTIASLAVGGNTNVSGNLNVTNVTRTDGTVTVDGTLVSDTMNATGTNNKLAALRTTAMGANNNISGADSTAMGTGINISGTNSVAVGTGHNVSGNNSGAFGDPNTVSGSGSYAIGNDNTISGDNTFVMGNNINTSANRAIGIGNNATVGADYAIAIGDTANASAASSVALGYGAIGGAANATAIGVNANATQANSIAIGNGATAAVANSVALGANATTTAASDVTTDAAFKTTGWAGTTADGVVSVGASDKERQLQNVAAGAVTATSTDAINGSQFYSELYVATAGNYINTSSNKTTAENLTALDTAMGKVTDGNYVNASSDTYTLAKNIQQIDTGLGAKITAAGNYINASSVNTINANIQALDTALGAKPTGTYISGTNSVNANLKALDDKSVASFGIGTSGNATITTVDNTTYSAQLQDYRVTSGSYDAANKKVTLTVEDAYGVGTSSTVEIAGLDTSRVVQAESGTAQTIAGGAAMNFTGATTASTATKNIVTTVSGDGTNASVAIGLADNVSIKNLTAAEGVVANTSVTAGTTANKVVLKDDLISVGTGANLSSTKLTVGTSTLTTDTLTVGGTTVNASGIVANGGNVKFTTAGISAGGQQITNVASGGTASGTNTNAANMADLYGATNMTPAGNYYTDNTGVTTAVKNIDTAMGKVATSTSGNLKAYDTTSAETIADTTMAANLTRLDAYDIASFATGTTGNVSGIRNNGSVVAVAQMANAKLDTTNTAFDATTKKLTIATVDQYDNTIKASKEIDLSGMSASAKFRGDSTTVAEGTADNATITSNYVTTVAGGDTASTTATKTKNITTKLTQTIENQDATIEVALNPNVVVDSVKAGSDTANTTISKDGIAVTGTGAGAALNSSALTVGTSTLTTTALTVGNAKVENNLISVGTNANLSNDKLTVGTANLTGTELNVSGSTLTGSQLKVGTSTLTTDTLTVGGINYITASGINAGNNRITNVAAATNDKDAVNFTQLKGYTTVNVTNSSGTTALANTGSGIVLKAGENAALAVSGNEVTISSLGGEDTLALHYDKDGGGARLNSATLKDALGGTEAAITLKNVANGTADNDAATYGQVKVKADKATTLAGYGITDAQTKLSDAQLTAANSGITATKVGSYDTHVANSDIHVTAAQKTAWDAKQDTLTTAQQNAVNSGITSAKVAAYEAYNGRITTNANDISTLGTRVGTAEDNITTLQGYFDASGNAKEALHAVAADSATSANYATTAGNATNATNDGAGNNIESTYATNATVNAIDTRVGTAEDNITNLQNDMTTVQGNVSTLSGKVITAEGKIGTLETKMSDAEGNITNLQNDMTTVQGDVSTLSGKVTSAAGKIGTLETKVSTAEDNITTLQNDMTTVQGDVSTLSGKVTTAEGKIGTLETKMSDAEGNITNLQNDMTTVQGDVSTLSGKVTSAEGKIGTLETKVSTAEGNITTLQNDMTAVQGDITGLDSRVTVTENKVQEMATKGTDTKDASGNETKVEAGKISVKDGAGTGTTTITSTEIQTNSVITNTITTNSINSKEVATDKVTVDGDTYITAAGIDANSKTITNVADAVNPTDAVNKQQLDKATKITVNGTETVSVAGGVNFAEGEGVTLDTSTAGTIKISASGVSPEIIAGKKAEGDEKSKATATGATAVGYNSEATKIGTTAVGYGNKATGERSTAVGYMNEVSGVASGAFGDPNIVSGSGSYAIGNNNTIAGNNNFVLGNNVTVAATVENSVALGNGSTVTESNVVSVGNESEGGQRRITNVAAGIYATDAATVGQLSGLADVVSRQQSQILETSKETREVGAMSAALAGLHYVEPTGEGDDKFTGAVAYGGYRGESAAAVGVAYKPNPNLMVSASTSVGNNQNMYNAGVGFKFGKGNTAATRAGLQKQVKYLNDKLESANAKIDQQDATIRTLLNRLETLEKKVQ